MASARRNPELDDYRDRLRYQLDRAAAKYEGGPDGEAVYPVLSAVRAWVNSPGDFTLVQLLHVATSPAPHVRPSRPLPLSAAPGMWATTAHP